MTSVPVSGCHASSSGRTHVCAYASSASLSPSGRWLGPARDLSTAGATELIMVEYNSKAECMQLGAEDEDFKPIQYGVELTADQWQPWDFDPLNLSPQHLAVRPHIDCCNTSCYLRKKPATLAP